MKMWTQDFLHETWNFIYHFLTSDFRYSTMRCKYLYISLFKICLCIFWRKYQIFHDSHLGTCVNFPSSNIESSLCNIWENFYQLSYKNEWKFLSHTWKYVLIWYEIIFHPRKFEWMFSNMKYRILYLSDLRIDFFFQWNIKSQYFTYENLWTDFHT